METTGERQPVPCWAVAGAYSLAGALSYTATLQNASHVDYNDWHIATNAGAMLLAGRLDIYAVMPEAQMGPLALLFSGVVTHHAAYMLLVCAVLPLVLWLVAPRPDLRTFAVVMLGAVILAEPWGWYGIGGHMDDALVAAGVCAMVLALRERRARWLLAAFAVAIAAKPIAIMFLPLVFLSSRRAGLAALALGGAVWAPFALADLDGFLSAGKGIVVVESRSLVALLGVPAGDPYPAWVRPVILGGGALLCWSVARRVNAPTAVAVVFAFRALLEPGAFASYSIAVLVGAVLVAASSRSLLVVGFAWASWLVTWLPWGELTSVLRSLALVGVMLAAVSATRRSDERPPTAEAGLPAVVLHSARD